MIVLTRDLRDRSEEGFSLIELLVAISLIGIIMSGLAFGLTTALATTRDSRERTIAANLASQEIDLAHAVPITNLQEGTLSRAERVGVTDFTIVRESRWENGAAEAAACTALANSATGRGRRFLQVNVTVTWDGIGLRGPVLASTAITPSVASYRAGFGHVAATVADRDAAPVQGIVVTLSGSGLTRVVTTTSIGCAFFSDVPPGSYTVSVNQPGYVDADPVDSAQLGSEAVTVVDRETTKTAFAYDRRAALNLTLESPNGGEVLDGVFAIAEANAATVTRFSGLGAGGASGRSIGVAPEEGLFPYSGGWTAWAGCEHNDPQDYGGTRLALNPDPGQTINGAVQAGTLRIRATTASSARQGQTLYALDQLAPSGSACAQRVAVGTFDSTGRLSRDVILPFGDWRLYVGLSATHLDTDPNLTAGLIQVRPGQVAAYVEDSVFLYYRLDESPSASAADSSGGNFAGTYQSGVVRGAGGALPAEANRAVTLDGTTSAYVTTPLPADDPDVLSFEIWFRTTTTDGGRIVGFGSSQTGQSGTVDRHLYMRDDGRLVFGVNSGGRRTITSASAYNDGAWHHAVVTLGPAGMALYVDGVRVANTASYTGGQSYTGYARVGYDTLNNWSNRPSSDAFAGSVDEFAAYPSQLTQARITAHYGARTGTNYASTVLADSPVYYYRFDDPAAPAGDSSGNSRHGIYQGGVTGGTAGALLNSSNTAVTLDGTAYVSNASQVTSPAAFSVEAWLRTASSRGGRIVGFGNASTGTSTTSDRHLYLRNNGRILFGVHPSNRTTIQSPDSPRYNDGAWHHVVGTYGPGGMALYVDGARVSSSGAVGAGTAYAGYWRVGADTLSGWTQAPTDAGLQGAVDEVKVYPGVLSAQQVAANYAASGR